MPNWATGELYISGESQNVINFLKNGIEGYKGVFIEDGDLDFDYDRDEYYHYIKMTERCFTTSDSIIARKCEDTDNLAAYVYVECAWDLDGSGFADISKKYNLDISGVIEEPNMNFEHEIDIRNGEVYLDETRDYEES